MSGGGVVNLDGLALYSYITRGNVEISYDDYLPVEFCGALGAMFFSVSYIPCKCKCYCSVVFFLVDKVLYKIKDSPHPQ